MKKKVPTSEFVKFLLNEIPRFDEQIMRQIQFSVSPIRIDARLLPPKERKKWIRAQFGERNQRRFKGATALRNKLYDFLLEWLESLPKRKQAKERAKRSGWIGHVSTGKVPMGSTEEATLDRFKAVWPKKIKPWKHIKVRGRPSKDINRLPSHYLP